jgi:Tfp pilus assembly protein PilX
MKQMKNKGFALPVALFLLVVMSVMASTLMNVSSTDHKNNDLKDTNQQAFYAAESGIAQAKKYVVNQKNLTPQNDPNNNLKFCKTSLFPNLQQGSVRAINNYIGSNNLSELISGSSQIEKERLNNFSYEYFITYSPDKNGLTNNPQKKSGTNNIYYSIFSCGCNGTKTACRINTNTIIPLEAVVTIVSP